MFSHAHSFFKTGLFLTIAFLGMHCEHAGPLEIDLGPDDGPPKLSQIQILFTQNCAIDACHVGSNALLGLDLSAGQSHENLVGVTSKEIPALHLVAPDQPDNSYLIMKLEGGPEMAAGTLRMPIGRSPLADTDIQKIRDWIAAGALDN